MALVHILFNSEPAPGYEYRENKGNPLIEITSLPKIFNLIQD
jgi:hypothetical protein